MDLTLGDLRAQLAEFERYLRTAWKVYRNCSTLSLDRSLGSKAVESFKEVLLFTEPWSASWEPKVKQR